RRQSFSSRLLDTKIPRLVQAHHECLESVAISQLHGELLRGVRAGNPSDAHAVETSCRRVVILNKNRLIVREQTIAQALGVPAVREGSDLHGEVANRGIWTGEQLDSHGSGAGA